MTKRFSALVPLAVLLLTLTAPVALAVEEGGADETTTTTTFAEGEAPAVVVPPPEAPDTELPWTDRFLIPTLVVTALLVVGGVTIYYFTRVKNRYRIVEG